MVKHYKDYGDIPRSESSLFERVRKLTGRRGTGVVLGIGRTALAVVVLDHANAI